MDDEAKKMLQRVSETTEKLQRQVRIAIWVIVAMTIAALLAIIWLYMKMQHSN